MADHVPVSWEDGPGTRGTAQGTDAVSGATAQQIDPAAVGAAFPRTHHIPAPILSRVANDRCRAHELER